MNLPGPLGATGVAAPSPGQTRPPGQCEYVRQRLYAALTLPVRRLNNVLGRQSHRGLTAACLVYTLAVRSIPHTASVKVMPRTFLLFLSSALIWQVQPHYHYRLSQLHFLQLADIKLEAAELDTARYRKPGRYIICLKFFPSPVIPCKCKAVSTFLPV